jgi:hypothetical protein
MQNILSAVEQLDNNTQVLAKGVANVLEQQQKQVDCYRTFGEVYFSLPWCGDNQRLIPTVTIEGQRGEPTVTRPLNDHALFQLMNKLNFDIRTARNVMPLAPASFTKLINDLKDEKGNEISLIRSYDDAGVGQGYVRALLSKKYKLLDNADVIESILPTVANSEGNWEVVKTLFSDTKMLVSLKSRKFVGEPAVGDTMALGLQFLNSEVGQGSCTLQQLMFTLACLNGMQTANNMRKTHLGKARSTEDLDVLTAHTKRKIADATLSEIKDNVSYYSQEKSFNQQIELMRLAHEDTLPNNVDNFKLCESLANNLEDHNKKDNKLLLESLYKTINQDGYKNKPISRATLVNTVTGVANLNDRFNNADVQEISQKAGNKILHMSKSAWRNLTSSAIPEPLVA